MCPVPSHTRSTCSRILWARSLQPSPRTQAGPTVGTLRLALMSPGPRVASADGQAGWSLISPGVFLLPLCGGGSRNGSCKLMGGVEVSDPDPGKRQALCMASIPGRECLVPAELLVQTFPGGRGRAWQSPFPKDPGMVTLMPRVPRSHVRDQGQLPSTGLGVAYKCCHVTRKLRRALKKDTGRHSAGSPCAPRLSPARYLWPLLLETLGNSLVFRLCPMSNLSTNPLAVSQESIRSQPTPPCIPALSGPLSPSCPGTALLPLWCW